MQLSEAGNFTSTACKNSVVGIAVLLLCGHTPTLLPKVPEDMQQGLKITNYNFLWLGLIVENVFGKLFFFCLQWLIPIKSGPKKKRGTARERTLILAL